MADNYLENQYEQYQARKAAWERERKYGKKKPNPTVNIPSEQPQPAAPPYAAPSAPSSPKRIFITGGAEGIGRAIVQTFCNAGWKVAFCDCNQASGQQTAQDTGAWFHPLDVSHAEALEHCLQAIFTEWGDLDALVNNAGISPFAPIMETRVEEFDRILSINLRPTFVTARALARHRQSLATPNLYGRIINICSTRHQMSEPGSEGYAASKGGIYSLTHALAASLAPLHITVNSIAPGWIQTHDYHLLRPEDHLQHPSRRVGCPDDIARMCLFLCHEENDFINAENLTIDGGMTKKMIYLE